MKLYDLLKFMHPYDYVRLQQFKGNEIIDIYFGPIHHLITAYCVGRYTLVPFDLKSFTVLALNIETSEHGNNYVIDISKN